MTPDIELVIDELVLHGFERGDRYRIGQAIQQELTTLLSGPENLTSFGVSQEIAQVDAGSVRLSQGAAPSEIGSQVAQSVYRGIGQ